MANFKLSIEYNGKDFSGSQSQTGKRTVQEELEKALNIYFQNTTSERISTNFSSRTDAGVHAIGQVLNFTIPEGQSKNHLELISTNPDKFLIGLNGILARDIAAVKIEEVDETFNARFSAQGREYMYKIFTRKHRPVLRLDSLSWVKESLDFNAMQAHAAKFIGTHNFSAYYRQEKYLKNPICTVTRSELIKENNLCFKYHIKADRFLRHMVRRIVGELIDIGKRAAQGEDSSQIEPKFNGEAYPHKVADASGLTLVKVYY